MPNQEIPAQGDRFAYEFNGNHAEFSNDITAVDGFSASFKLKLPSDPAVSVIIGGDITAGVRFYVGTEDDFLLVGNGNDRIVTASTVRDGREHSVLWTVSGGTFEVSVDSVVIYSQPLQITLPDTINRVMEGISGQFETTGKMYDLTIDGVFWAMDSVGGPVQPSQPTGNPLTIQAYSGAQWELIYGPATIVNALSDQWISGSCGLIPSPSDGEFKEEFTPEFT